MHFCGVLPCLLQVLWMGWLRTPIPSPQPQTFHVKSHLLNNYLDQDVYFSNGLEILLNKSRFVMKWRANIFITCRANRFMSVCGVKPIFLVLVLSISCCMHYRGLGILEGLGLWIVINDWKTRVSFMLFGCVQVGMLWKKKKKKKKK
jgi:hypothetical protein